MFDWAGRYRERDTPWDLGRAHPELVRRLREAPRPGGRALVAGCGRGYDALALAEAGWRVTALDVVRLESDALARLQELGGDYRIEDALAFRPDEPFDLAFDHTFFCALEPSERAAWGASMARALAPSARLWALVFPGGKDPARGGPPFGMVVEDLAVALGTEFHLELDEPVGARVAKRSWDERWASFRRGGVSSS